MKLGYANKSGFNVNAVRVGSKSESKDAQAVRTRGCTEIIFIMNFSCVSKDLRCVCVSVRVVLRGLCDNYHCVVQGLGLCYLPAIDT